MVFCGNILTFARLFFLRVVSPWNATSGRIVKDRLGTVLEIKHPPGFGRGIRITSVEY